MRAALGAAIAGILVLGPACGTSVPCGDCNYPYLMYLVISQERGVVPVGLFQTIGVRIPGSDRTLSPGSSDRIVEQGGENEPGGSTLLVLVPVAGADFGKPLHFGGIVHLAATTGWFQSPWDATIQLTTDPLSGHDPHTYVGSGTTQMQIGQTFVMTWPVGAPPPVTSDPSVLRPLGDPIERATRTVGESSAQSVSYMMQLFVGAGIGHATLAAPSAFDPRDGRPFGPSQQFYVVDDHRWKCSPAGGCSTSAATEDNWRPDHYDAPRA